MAFVRRDDGPLAVLNLDHGCDLGVQALEPGAQKRLVGGVLDQRVLEAIGDIWRSAAPVDQRDVIGSIETCATSFATGPEMDTQGKPLGLQKAINDAMANALKTFAPRLVPAAPFPQVVEVPQRADDSIQGGALAAIDKLRKLESLYPELSADDLAALASSRARFLIVAPGRLSSVGLERGDLVSGMGGQTLGSRAALARTLARGDVPAMSVDRVGGRFLVGQTLVARAR